MTTIPVTFGDITITSSVGELPFPYNVWRERALLHDDFGIDGTDRDDGTLLIVAVELTPAPSPQLLISQRFSPGPTAGFLPGALFVPETDLLFLGAGERLLAYDLKAPHRLWEDVADVGFLRWRRHGDAVVMSAELELAAWDLEGAKLWSTFVEPPWSYEVRGSRLHLDVVGRTSEFDLYSGPSRT